MPAPDKSTLLKHFLENVHTEMTDKEVLHILPDSKLSKNTNKKETYTFSR